MRPTVLDRLATTLATPLIAALLFAPVPAEPAEVNLPASGPGRAAAAQTAGKPTGLDARADGAIRALIAQSQSRRAQGLPDAAPPADSPLQVRGNRVVVDITATGDPAALLAELEDLGMTNASTFGRIISGALPVGALSRTLALPGLQAISAARKPQVNVGAIEGEGGPAMLTDQPPASAFDGTGMRVGILSDSFDQQGGYADGIASGDLKPGAVILDDSANCGNPCGDEGRGMAELVEDVAPGATIAFHTAFGGVADFANGIIELADPALGDSDVIVDDVFYFAEPMFQDGPIAQAIDQVVAGGVPYFSSAGNFARASYESAYVDSGELFYVNNIFSQEYRGRLHDFDPGPGTDWSMGITVPNYPSWRIVTLVLQWDQPVGSISTAGRAAENDLDVYITSTGSPSTLYASSVDNNSSLYGGNGDPIELLQFQVGGCDILYQLSGYGCVPSGPAQILVSLYDGGNPNSGGPDYSVEEPGLLKWIIFDRDITFEYPTNSSSSFGHANAAGAEAVGAAYWGATPAWDCDDPDADPDANTFDNCEWNAQGELAPQLEFFSSAGGTPILFLKNGNRLNNPDVRPKPGVTGPDGANTTFFIADSTRDEDTLPNFFGTSASAPHVAAVAALMREADPTLTPAEIYDILRSTAQNMNPRPTGEPEDSVTGFDFDTGYGFVQADLALAAIVGGGDTPPTVTLTSPAPGGPLAGTIAVTADATDDNGVTQVEFFANGISFHVDTMSGDGWTASWDSTTSPDGDVTLTAIATDTIGQTDQSPGVVVTIDNIDEPPTADVTTPTDGSIVSGMVTLTADASDDRGVTQVSFTVNGTDAGTDTDSAGGWSVNWDSTALADGTYTVEATATDTAGQTGAGGTVQITLLNADAPPTVSILTPAAGATVNGIVLVSADVGDDNGVVQVDFAVEGSHIGTGADPDGDGVYVAMWDTAAIPGGNIGNAFLLATARDTANQTSSDTISVDISNDLPPEVSMDPALNGASVSGTVLLTALATDDVGVVLVEFYADDNLIGADSVGADGWTLNWNTTGGADGDYAVHAVAYDTTNIANSDPVTITVRNTFHVGDLDYTSDSQRGNWSATVAIRVDGFDEAPIAGAEVSGTFENDGVDSVRFCTTNASGTCAVTSPSYKKRDGTAVFTVDTVTGPVGGPATYASAANHDDDGDSSGTAITVTKP